MRDEITYKAAVWPFGRSFVTFFSPFDTVSGIIRRTRSMTFSSSVLVVTPTICPLRKNRLIRKNVPSWRWRSRRKHMKATVRSPPETIPTMVPFTRPIALLGWSAITVVVNDGVVDVDVCVSAVEEVPLSTSVWLKLFSWLEENEIIKLSITYTIATIFQPPGLPKLVFQIMTVCKFVPFVCILKNSNSPSWSWVLLSSSCVIRVTWLSNVTWKWSTSKLFGFARNDTDEPMGTEGIIDILVERNMQNNYYTHRYIGKSLRTFHRSPLSRSLFRSVMICSMNHHQVLANKVFETYSKPPLWSLLVYSELRLWTCIVVWEGLRLGRAGSMWFAWRMWKTSSTKENEKIRRHEIQPFQEKRRIAVQGSHLRALLWRVRETGCLDGNYGNYIGILLARINVRWVNDGSNVNSKSDADIRHIHNNQQGQSQRDR